MDVIGTDIVPYDQPASSQCPATPCPYCQLGLPHSATSTDVLNKSLAMTSETNLELNKAVCSYTRSCGAERHVLQLVGSDADLPVAPTLFALLGEVLVNDYVQLMAPLVNPRPPAPAASADQQATDLSSKGQERWLAEDEFPQWQYRSGAKHNKWSTYDIPSNEQLEFAYKNGAVMVELCLDEWDYTVNLITLTQHSLKFGTVRAVRRVAGPQDGCTPRPIGKKHD